MPELGTIAIGLAVLLVAVPAAVVGLIFLARPVWKGLWWFVVHVATFVGREAADILRIIGALLTSIALAPIAGVNAMLGRMDGARHYGRAIRSELAAMVGCVYRVLMGNPARLLMLTALTEGFEQRIPHAIAHSPTSSGGIAGGALPGTAQHRFEGYTIVGTLPGGGSGARLYIAEAGQRKLLGFARDGQENVGRVVIKSFSLSDGSTLAQIVRENRALPAAQRMGLILEHELTEERFHYVTRYVPGESLALVTRRLHGASEEKTGLDDARLREAVGYGSDILRTLSRYHSGGLWHKDVKPDNIIVHDGAAELVDFGLVTPLRSSMTLTTHGTEYFRDPEMVRMALRGVKVHEVDGGKFDVYAAGAVLYSMVENSFPAHGGLSQISRRCPEALRWIVRRAMTDYDRRYESAAAMLADVERVLTSPDAFALRPADLPSVRHDAERGVEPSSRVLPIPGPDMDEVGGPRVGAAIEPMSETPGLQVATVEPEFPAAALVAGSESGPARDRRGARIAPKVLVGPGGELPVFRVVNWWSGRYTMEPAALGPAPGFDTAEALAGERERAKAARKGVAVKARSRGRRTVRAPWERRGLSRGAKVGIGVGALALIVNVALLTRSSGARSGVQGVVSRVRETLGFERGADERARSMGTALVLWDGEGLGLAAYADMRERVNRLQKAGFELVGTTTPSEDARRAAHEADEIKDLRARLEGLEFRSDHAADTVRRWLRGRGRSLVVWIHGEGANQPKPWVIGEDGIDADTLRTAHRAVGQ